MLSQKYSETTPRRSPPIFRFSRWRVTPIPRSSGGRSVNQRRRTVVFSGPSLTRSSSIVSSGLTGQNEDHTTRVWGSRLQDGRPHLAGSEPHPSRQVRRQRSEQQRNGRVEAMSPVGPDLRRSRLPPVVGVAHRFSLADQARWCCPASADACPRRSGAQGDWTCPVSPGPRRDRCGLVGSGSSGDTVVCIKVT